MLCFPGKHLGALGRICVAGGNVEKMGYKIREATVKKIPYMLVVGGKEAENGTISLRSYKNGDEGVQSFEDFRQALKVEIAERA